MPCRFRNLKKAAWSTQPASRRISRGTLRSVNQLHGDFRNFSLARHLRALELVSGEPLRLQLCFSRNARFCSVLLGFLKSSVTGGWDLTP